MISTFLFVFFARFAHDSISHANEEKKLIEMDVASTVKCFSIEISSILISFTCSLDFL